MNNMVLQGDILSALKLGSVLVLAQALSKMVHVRVKEWVFCPIVLYTASPR